MYLLAGMFKLIDTHCHLAHKKLIKNCRNVLNRAGEVGVAAVVCASADLGNQCRAALSRRYEGIYFTAGLHPHEAKSADSSYLADLEQLAGQCCAWRSAKAGWTITTTSRRPPVSASLRRATGPGRRLGKENRHPHARGVR